MTDKMFSEIWADAQKTTDVEAFASAWATSPVFLDPEEPDQEPSPELVEALRVLWGVAHWTFRDLLARMEMSQTGCATRFCVPLRTVQGWALGERECPSYIRLMMAEATGITTRHLERSMSMRMYYFINDGIDPSEVYGSEAPVCIDREELLRLCSEWGDEFRDMMHVATEAEIEEYGVYDS